jgi:hypothetical protein
MFEKRSKLLVLASILGGLYAIYLLTYFFGAVDESQGAEQIGTGLATALIIPHLVAVIFASVFGFLGFFLRSNGFSLTSGILYCVATILFLIYFMFTTPLIILTFIGYSKQKKMNSKEATKTVGVRFVD